MKRVTSGEGAPCTPSEAGCFESQSGRWGEAKNLLTLMEIEPPLLGRRVGSVVAIPSELSELLSDRTLFCISKLCYMLSWMHEC
jgi:hypothetical protein